MTKDEVARYISYKTVWIPSGQSPITLEEYYNIIDDFTSMLINNPPKELLP